MLTHGCLFLYKGNQFFANHNEILLRRVDKYAVCSSTKVINFLLITTDAIICQR